jgi:hypothetical protein
MFLNKSICKLFSSKLSKIKIKYSSITTSINYQNKKGDGLQDVFYYEPSTLLKGLNKNDKLYLKLHEKIPVILLFGWTHSYDSHLKKYQLIYKNMGYHTLRISPSFNLTIFQHSKHKSYAYELLNLLKDNLSKNKILIHMFSNAGIVIMYHHIINEIKNGKSKKYNFFTQNHKGIIYDSAIGLLGKRPILIQAVADIIKNDIKFAPLRYFIATSFALIYWIKYEIIQKDVDYFSKTFNITLNDDRLVPTLSLYSIADRVVDPKNIVKHFDSRKKLYPDLYLKTVIYDDADHTLLYPNHTEDYVKHVVEHLKYCKLDLKTVLDHELYKEIDSKSIVEI